MDGTDDLAAAAAAPLVLAVLTDGEEHGYGLVKRLREVAGREPEWSDGMIYPLLRRLRRAGYVTAEWRTGPGGRRRRYYALTDAGRGAPRDLGERRRGRDPGAGPWRAGLGLLRTLTATTWPGAPAPAAG